MISTIQYRDSSESTALLKRILANQVSFTLQTAKKIKLIELLYLSFTFSWTERTLFRVINLVVS